MERNSNKTKIEKLETEIKRLTCELKKRKKYGIVWEEKPEDVVEQCKTELPVLDEVEDKEIKTESEKPVNLLIEGDNYHALSVLNYTHKGKVDGIYIDPPYNTGAKDWTYNNNYVDSEDPYRHSKWLSMMAHRLRLAKNLLTQKGIICVTIDDYELPRLLLLMEEMFGEFNHLGTIAIRNNPAGRSTMKGISITHEYALFFGRTLMSHVGRLSRTQKQKDRYDEKDEKGYFEWVNFRKPGGLKQESPKMFYPIFATSKNMRIPEMKWDSNKNEWVLLEKPKKGEEIIYPIDDNDREKRWRWGVERTRKELSEFKTQNQKGKLHIYVKGRLTNEGILPMTWWDKKEYSATAYGTNFLKDMFSELGVFSYPKSIFAVEDCIKVLTNKNDALILDFFAGSGTTGHAVLRLNREDGGNRKFILCTNNENNIATDVCHPRIEKAITGYKTTNGKMISGLGGNLKYFRTSFVPAEPTDRNKIKLTVQATEMLCIKEGTFEKIIDNNVYKIFRNKDYYTGIIWDHSAIQKFKNKIKDIQGNFKVYIFSLGDETFDDDFQDIKYKVELLPIPEVILRVYRRIFK
jgi:adenine-specific DNA-methyltransferase